MVKQKRQRKPSRPSRHHRKPVSLGGKDIPANISIVDCKSHEAWHTLFANNNPYVICDIINKIWLDPSFEFVCFPRQIFKKP